MHRLGACPHKPHLKHTASAPPCSHHGSCATRAAQRGVASSKEQLLAALHRAALALPKSARQAHSVHMNCSTAPRGQTNRPDPAVVAPSEPTLPHSPIPDFLPSLNTNRCAKIRGEWKTEIGVEEPPAEPPREGPPAEEPPREGPPAVEPPAEEPPREGPPAVETPAEEPPREGPPAVEPPAEGPPAVETPAEEPPREGPPAVETPAKGPPAVETPAEGPPAVETPAEEPPREVPPAGEPPAEEPLAKAPPVEEPPAEPAGHAEGRGDVLFEAPCRLETFPLFTQAPAPSAVWQTQLAPPWPTATNRSATSIDARGPPGTCLSL
jgi:hypothetical protein